MRYHANHYHGYWDADDLLLIEEELVAQVMKESDLEAQKRLAY